MLCQPGFAQGTLAATARTAGRFRSIKPTIVAANSMKSVAVKDLQRDGAAEWRGPLSPG